MKYGAGEFSSLSMVLERAISVRSARRMGSSEAGVLFVSEANAPEIPSSTTSNGINLFPMVFIIAAPLRAPESRPGVPIQVAPGSVAVGWNEPVSAPQFQRTESREPPRKPQPRPTPRHRLR